MTDQPDPAFVRDLARETLHAVSANSEYRKWGFRTALRDRGIDHRAMAVARYDALWLAVTAEMDKAGPVSWPDGQPQDERDDSFAIIADGAPAGPARNVVNHWNSYATVISKGAKSPEWAAIAYVTASILDAMNAEQDERDADLRTVAAVINAREGYEEGRALNSLAARFHSRIAALDARTTDGGAE